MLCCLLNPRKLQNDTETLSSQLCYYSFCRVFRIARSCIIKSIIFLSQLYEFTLKSLMMNCIVLKRQISTDETGCLMNSLADVFLYKKIQFFFIWSRIFKTGYHLGFFLSCVCFNKRTATNQIHLCIIASLSPVCTRSKNFLERHLCHRWKWKLPSKNWHQGKHSSRRSNLTVNFQDIKKDISEKKSTKIWSLTYAVFEELWLSLTCIALKKKSIWFLPRPFSVLGNLIKSFMRRD